MSAKQVQLPGMPVDDAADRVGRATFAAILEARRLDPAFRLTELTLTGCLRASLALELPKTARIAGRNQLFDALAAACGLEEPFTRSASGQVGKALAEIVKAFPAIDAPEITRCALAIRKKYENAGPVGVSAHFHEFVRRAPKKPKATAPVGWLLKFNELYPDSTLSKGGMHEISKETEYAWGQLADKIRSEIMEAML